MANMTTSAMNMSSAGSTSVVASGTDSSSATQKDNSQGTDGSFLSILASISGVMPSVTQFALKPENASLKSRKDLAIGQSGRAKAGLVSGAASIGAKLDKNDKSIGISQPGNRTASKQKLSVDKSKNEGMKDGLANHTADTAALTNKNASKTGNVLAPHVSTDLQDTQQAGVQASPGKLPENIGLQQNPQTAHFAYLMSQTGAKVSGQAGANTDHPDLASGLHQIFSKQISGKLTGHEVDAATSDRQMVLDSAGNKSTDKGADNPELSKINLVHAVVAHASGISAHNGTQSQVQANTLDVSQANWMDNFGNMVGQVSSDNGGTIQVKVHPEGMGDLLISVSNTAAGLSIQLEANQYSTAQWLGQQTGQLTNAVSQLGINVANVQVGFGQAGLGQSGNGHPNRKSNDSEKQISSVMGVSDNRSNIQEPVSLSDGGVLYRRNSSISFQA